MSIKEEFDNNTKYFLISGWILFAFPIAGCEYHGVI